MAEGDLVVVANQYEFNSLVAGRNTPYIVSDINGLLSMPQLEDNDVHRQDSVGVWANAAYAGPRTVDFDITALMNTPTLAEAAVAALSAAFQSQPNVFHKLVYSRPGMPTRYLWAQCRKREFKANYELTHGLVTGSVQLFCPDPRIYALVASLTNQSISPGSSTASVIVNNNGNYNAPAIFSIAGPAINPIITNSDLTRAIRTNITLGGADILLIDTRLRTCLLNGVDSYHSLRNDNQWFDLAPGANHLVLTRTGTSGTTTVGTSVSDVWM